MNPNINKLPAPDINPAGVNSPGSEFGAVFQPNEKTPSKEVDRVKSLEPTTPAPQALTSGVTFQQATPIAHVADGAATPAIASAAEPDEEFEKKWVSVAKAIVERTKDDPHLQSQQLSKTGREYREKLRSRS